MRAANAQLFAITSADAPLARFENRLEQFDGALAAALNSMSAGVPARPDSSLNQLFSDVLSAFAAFVNQTPHWLIKLFRGDTPSAEAFRSACRLEYDRAFEYRLAYNLQNETRHRADVLRVEYRKALGEPGHVDVAIADEVLDHAIHDDKWQARVRREIETHNRPIEAADLLLVLRGCVQRIHLRSLLAERNTMDRAINLVQSMADGAQCVGELALVTRRPAPPGPSPSRLTLKFQNLEIRAASHLREVLTEAERLVWPRFAVQVSTEWLERSAADALLNVVASDPTIGTALISYVEPTGAFVGVTAANAYAAGSAVARAIVRSGVTVHDQRSGPPIPLP
ncbi:MAG TPA: hypothetical protein VND96_13565 [Candidatus Micrarchaeaceae archaeon]|nr:hypothetical protein [Candidatus Micrarchaeaceae archaeon]